MLSVGLQRRVIDAEESNRAYRIYMCVCLIERLNFSSRKLINLHRSVRRLCFPHANCVYEISLWPISKYDLLSSLSKSWLFIQ